MNVIGNFIFGLPEDDLSSMRATLDLALDVNCELPLLRRHGLSRLPTL